MATNLWDDLNDSEKAQLVNLALEGKSKTPENINRVREQFATNPTYTDKFARETGLLTPDDAPSEGKSDLEKNVESSLEDEMHAQNGLNSSRQTQEENVMNVSPPEEGEDIQDYYRRISNEVGQWETGRPQESPTKRAIRERR